MSDVAPEFKVGDVITFRPYTTSFKLKVGEITRGYDANGRNLVGEPDDRIFYHCSSDGKPPYTNVTTGKSIVESSKFEPADCDVVMTAILYDKKGIPILPGDTLKVFHFTAALRREKVYMYKYVESIEHKGSKCPLMRIKHLNLKDDYYYELVDGRVLKDYEVVQGSDDYYRDRKRIKVKR
jgi:hypothetical protein